ncbi:LysR family transcriptional regulator [Rhodococcus sp. PAMC28707]|uniref:LysR family transcriptional regulator n=1 Tax=unclassified Rhodococcus (in: high G+C Gram-positive bacteria) TaxID=192944 RepID=UPI00109DC7EE|nr:MULTISPECIES: LysR family transcriptional regulator [unclassified Rhodococcus (in: high G+C Gram-positive bacteria)]QCB51765.1 LysR family transcriptional regulator [Rhodococcus sp. PAMC28705]QCB60067.1 LysR family transcriptional regulator [Rhodococcus sp. PAMC28707]
MSPNNRPAGQRGTLDLNLVLSLDALLRERSVGRAAVAVGLSQPAMSAALARLRRFYGDRLLERVGNAYELTPLGHSLVGRTEIAVSAVGRVLDAEPDVDIYSSTREFTLLISDYMVATVGDIIVRALLAEAPEVRVQFLQLRSEVVDNASVQLLSADAMMVSRGPVDGLPSTDLFSDRWACVVAEDNSHIGSSIEPGQLARFPWADFQTYPRASATPLGQLRAHGVEPFVQVVGENFLALPYLVAGTDRIAFLPERLANVMGERMGIRTVKFPFELAPLNHALWWHPIRADDPGHRWFRRRIVDSVAYEPNST